MNSVEFWLKLHRSNLNKKNNSGKKLIIIKLKKQNIFFPHFYASKSMFYDNFTELHWILNSWKEILYSVYGRKEHILINKISS